MWRREGCGCYCGLSLVFLTLHAVAGGGQWKLDVSGDRALVVAVWITRGCLFFPFLPHVHRTGSCLRHEHILQIAHSGTFLHPTPACPRDFLIMNGSFLN